MRYEPHRVWVVEATLKAGKRHIYAKRTFYIDEDSWQIAHEDAYDGRGELWRVHELAEVQYYDAPAPWFACETIYDLQARRYLVTGLWMRKGRSSLAQKSRRVILLPTIYVGSVIN